MSMLTAVVALSCACSNDDWIYRPIAAEDASDVLARKDAVDEVREDVQRIDVLDARVDSSAPDSALRDGTSDPETIADADVDARADDVGDTGRDVTPLDAPSDASSTRTALHTIGFTTTGSDTQSAGALRLIEGGYEWGDRVCVRGFCLTGGLLR